MSTCKHIKGRGQYVVYVDGGCKHLEFVNGIFVAFPEKCRTCEEGRDGPKREKTVFKAAEKTDRKRSDNNGRRKSNKAQGIRTVKQKCH